MHNIDDWIGLYFPYCFINNIGHWCILWYSIRSTHGNESAKKVCLSLISRILLKLNLKVVISILWNPLNLCGPIFMDCGFLPHRGYVILRMCRFSVSVITCKPNKFLKICIRGRCKFVGKGFPRLPRKLPEN